MEDIRCAVVGLGQGLEDVYVLLNHPRLRVTAVCDTDRAPYEWIRGESALADAGVDISTSAGHLRLIDGIRESPGADSIEYVEHYEELLARDDIDAVVLVVPDPLHVPYSIMALEAGKFVMCSKPMAVDIGSALRLAETARAHPGRFMVGFQMSNSTFARTVLSVVESGEVGEPRQIRFDYHRHPWRPMHATKNAEVDGSILKEGTHWLDLIYRLNGQRPWTRIAGFAGRDRLHDIEFEDNGTLIVDYDGGFRATHTFSYFRRSSRREDFLLVGEKGTMRGDFERLLVETDAGERTVEAPWPDLPAERHFGYVGMHDAFAAMIHDGVEPASNWRSGLENMLTCHAAQIAVANNEMVSREDFADVDWRTKLSLAESAP
jgi:UDP-N-acetylglucosamine 3-dehydrogenase